METDPDVDWNLKWRNWPGAAVPLIGSLSRPHGQRGIGLATPGDFGSLLELGHQALSVETGLSWFPIVTARLPHRTPSGRSFRAL